MSLSYDMAIELAHVGLCNGFAEIIAKAAENLKPHADPKLASESGK